MKHVLLIIIIILILPYHSFSNEYIIIRVCKAIAGCPVNINTGECPTCVNEKRKRYGKIKRITNLCCGYLETWRK